VEIGVIERLLRARTPRGGDEALLRPLSEAKQQLREAAHSARSGSTDLSEYAHRLESILDRYTDEARIYLAPPLAKPSLIEVNWWRLFFWRE
jgi:hypothetical protein